MFNSAIEIANGCLLEGIDVLLVSLTFEDDPVAGSLCGLSAQRNLLDTEVDVIIDGIFGPDAVMTKSCVSFSPISGDEDAFFLDLVSNHLWYRSVCEAVNISRYESYLCSGTAMAKFLDRHVGLRESLIALRERPARLGPFFCCFYFVRLCDSEQAGSPLKKQTWQDSIT